MEEMACATRYSLIIRFIVGASLEAIVSWVVGEEYQGEQEQ